MWIVEVSDVYVCELLPQSGDVFYAFFLLAHIIRLACSEANRNNNIGALLKLGLVLASDGTPNVKIIIHR